LIQRPGAAGAAAAFGCGAGAVALSAVVMAAALIFTDEGFFTVAVTAIAVHLPVMVIEGVITAICISFLRKVKPELLPLSTPDAAVEERSGG
jgi:cobalt/nickel transport system permease protein